MGFASLVVKDFSGSSGIKKWARENALLLALNSDIWAVSLECAGNSLGQTLLRTYSAVLFVDTVAPILESLIPKDWVVAVVSFGGAS